MAFIYGINFTIADSFLVSGDHAKVSHFLCPFSIGISTFVFVPFYFIVIFPTIYVGGVQNDP